ncbi:MAG: OmpA family protein [Muribaculaceae bacterium]|nr:OmpA family protein [Muribaculaceae bacterium]
MKLNKILLSAALVASAASAYAQEEVTEFVFNPHWYVQGQFGAQETLGESSFGHLLSPNAQVTVGYNFNPYIGARLAVNAWRSKGAEKVSMAGPEFYSCDDHWQWYYVAPTVDAVVNLTNVFGGYNPTRLVDVNLLAGVGVNVGFDNKEAIACNDRYFVGTGKGYQELGNLWDGTKARFVGQFGADINFNINKNWAVGLELMANVLPDGYNSKIGENADWYFNGLVGVKYTFGDKFTKRTRVIEAPAPVERIIERIVEVPAAPVVQQPVVEKKEAVQQQKTLKKDIFFRISTTTIVKAEMAKVAEVAEFMKANPETKVVVTGYADKGTGTMAINLRLSMQRAQAVANALKTKYGIAADRITVKSMGEAEDQPYSDPVDNRVAICVVK